jgi:hypothetical protein
MIDPLTVEQGRAQAIAELMAMPGPKPLKPIPPDLKAEAIAEFEMESEEEVARQVEELLISGGVPIEPLLERLSRMVQEGR